LAGLFFNQAANGFAKTQQRNKFVLIVLNGITVDDLKGYSGFREILKNSAVGLLNTKTKTKKDNATAGYLSIGAGAKALTGDNRLEIYNLSEEISGAKAASIYNSRIGFAPKNFSDSVAILDWANILRLSYGLDQSATPGLLGDTLKRNRIKFSVLGNADYINVGDGSISNQRNIALIAADKNGFVNGHVDSSLNKKDSYAPGGFRVDDRIYLRTFRNDIANNDLIFLEWGDFSRFDRETEFMIDQKISQNRRTTLKNSATFIGNILKILGRESDRYQVLITSVTQSKRMEITKSNLTPVVLIDSNLKGSNLVSSDSTKRSGIVTNTDIAPTILKFFNKKYAGFEGTPISFSKAERAIDQVVQMNNKIINKNRTAKIMLNVYVYFLVIILIAGIYMIAFPKENAVYSGFASALIFLLLMPLVFLVLPLLSSIFLSAVGFVAVGITLSVAISLLIKEKLLRLLIIFLATYFAIVGDVITGQNLIKSSILGYDPITGARFYGIGNEFMGVLLGCTVMAIAVLLQKNIIPGLAKKIIVPVTLLITVFIIGSPVLGANFGGLIASAIGFSYATYKFLGVKKIGLKHIFSIIAFMLFALIVVIFADIGSKNGFSHGAKAIFRISNGGLYEALKIIAVKTLSNVKLVYFSIWTKLIVVTLIGFSILLMRPVGLISQANQKYPEFMNGIKAVIVSAVAAFFFNDSGVVAAAITLIFAVVPLIYLLILLEEPFLSNKKIEIKVFH
jgi:hypothetical protein